MKLYLIFINDLIQELRKYPFGAKIRNFNISCPAYADDITTVSLRKPGLNGMLDIANKHSKKWRYDFSAEKCVGMIWGKDEMPNMPFRLGESEINIVGSCRHMGVTLASDRKLEETSYYERIGAAQNTVFAALGRGSFNTPMAPTVLSKLYWSITIPKLRYGMEVVPLMDNGIKEMEKAHRKNARIIQGLPENTAMPATLASIHWLSIATYTEMIKILFLFKILLLPDGNLYKTIAKLVLLLNDQELISFTRKGLGSSPVIDMYNSACKYNFDNIIWDIIFSRTKVSFESLKRTCKSVIQEYEKQRSVATMIMYSNLKLYIQVFKINSNMSINAWWVAAKDHPQYMKCFWAVNYILLGSEPKGMQVQFGNRLCVLCKGENGTAMHVLFHCDRLVSTRNRFWTRLISSMPPALANELEYRNGTDKLFWLVSPLGNTYVKEWAQVYCNIALFVYAMYKRRHEVYQNMLQIDNI